MHASVDDPVASVAALLMVVVLTMAFVCAPVSEPKGGGGEDEIPERFECGDKEGEGGERGNSKGKRDAERKASESMTTLPGLLLVFVRAAVQWVAVALGETRESRSHGTCMFVLAFRWSICLYGMTEMEGKEEGGPPKGEEDSCYKRINAL